MGVRQPEPGGADLGFLFDVDNTMLDNDRVIAELREFLRGRMGQADAQVYWDIFEELRTELGYADYLGALQRYRTARPNDLRILTVSTFLITYPFAERLYPDALGVVEACARQATVALLSDGDVVFQPWKIERSGLHSAVQGRVLIYVHKEEQLADVEQRLGCAHYVMIDDKLRLLSAAKAFWGPRVTTVFVQQGHYALDAANTARFPPADLQLARVGELAAHMPAFLSSSLSSLSRPPGPGQR